MPKTNPAPADRATIRWPATPGRTRLARTERLRVGRRHGGWTVWFACGAASWRGPIFKTRAEACRALEAYAARAERIA